MNIIIGNAWPYANGPLHLGRIAVLLPGDILARYHRMMGDDVVFLSGYYEGTRGGNYTFRSCRKISC